MAARNSNLSATFVGIRCVDENYHSQHSQLLHQHEDALELFYVMRGSGFYNVDGQKYALHPGSIVICNAGISHGELPFSAHSMQSYCCVLQDVAAEGFPPNRLSDPAVCPVLDFRGKTKDAVDDLMLSIYTFDKLNPDNRAVCEILAIGLLNFVYLQLQQPVVSNRPKQKRTEEIIRYVTEYLDTHYAEPLSLQKLEERFNINQYYLSHIFKAQLDISPMRYVLNRKIGEAQSLLMNTDMPIGEISESLGFSDNCHLSSMFKKCVGITPTQYRRHFKESGTPLQFNTLKKDEKEKPD